VSTQPTELRVVLLLRSLGYVRLFDPVIRGLLARGHHVHLLHERDVYTERERAWLAAIEREPDFSWSLTGTLYRDPWARFARPLRRFADLLFFLGPGYVGSETQIDRAEKRTGPRLSGILRLPGMRSPRARGILARAVEVIDRSTPVSRELARELAGLDADVLVLAPHLLPGGRHSEYVRAARAVGVPTCRYIASWDNLSSKQQLREAPDRLVVWNRVQHDEAVRLHGIDPARIVITGAPSFDQWFEHRPRPREEFAARVGLAPDRPYLLFVAGALFPAELTEAEYVRDVWIPQLREDPRFRDVQLLIRPHPRRLDQWRAVSFDALPDVAVWPREEASMPVDTETRDDFFDSIHHSAAVVGINTTAMIEAAVVGRSVHTVFDPTFAGSQRGAFHFDYLLEVGGGAVRAAESYERHRDDLAAAIAGDDVDAGRRQAFVQEFVRPHGLENAALPRVVAAIEEVAAAGPQPAPRPPAHLAPLRLALRGLVATIGLARRVKRSLA
jgi:hypothetical protein